jgi:hypothetical protein
MAAARRKGVYRINGLAASHHTPQAIISRTQEPDAGAPPHIDGVSFNAPS